MVRWREQPSKREELVPYWPTGIAIHLASLALRYLILVSLGSIDSTNHNQFQNKSIGTSLAVQWLTLCPSTTGGTGLIPEEATKILCATWWAQKKQQPLCPLKVVCGSD